MMSIPQTSPSVRPRGLVCPACRHALERRHRNLFDRVLSLFGDPAHPLRRYACADSRCGWEGLLRGHLSRRPSYLRDHWL